MQFVCVEAGRVLVPGNDKVRSVGVFPYFQDGASGFAYRFYQQELPVFDDTPAGIGENLPRLSIRCLEYILGLGGIESKWMQNFKQQGFRRRFLQQGADLYPLVCHYPLLGFFYTFIIYNGGIIQVSGRFKNTFFYCGIYFLHHGQQVQPYFVPGIFVLKISAVRDVGLPDAFKIAYDFLAANT